MKQINILHKKLLITLITIAIAMLAYYFIEYRSLDAVNAKVAAWQKSMANYLTFNYKTISQRLGSNTITLNEVHITYPILMSIDKLVVNPEMQNSQLVKLNMRGEGVNFTWPSFTGLASWQGDMHLNYHYLPDIREMVFNVKVEFPNLIQGNGSVVFSQINPSVGLVFDYPDVLLNAMQFQAQNQGFIQAYAASPSMTLSSDELLLKWMNQQVSPAQRQALAEFWANKGLLNVDFQPDKPVPVHRILGNPRLLWQHPDIRVQSN